MDEITQGRRVERLVAGKATSDGAGVKLTRVLTQDLQVRLDPFLMLDAFKNENADDYIGGFPDHPHRGFETVTYMLAGHMRHHDSAGNSGLLGPGGAQWMTAGSGLVHSELPEQEDGLMEGFQLWLNLPAKAKMCAPHYRDIPPEEIPEFEHEGVLVRVIAGNSHGVTGSVIRSDTEPLYLDARLSAGTTFEQAIPEGHNAFVFVYRGNVAIEGKSVPDRTMAILENTGDGARIQAQGAARVLLIAGKPLKEPIVQYGPFVMNTQAQIQAAFEDYRAGKFEAASVRKDG